MDVPDLHIETDGTLLERINEDTFEVVWEPDPPPVPPGPSYAEMMPYLAALFPAPTITRNPDGSITSTFDGTEQE